MSCAYQHSDGAYVLGALSPAEREEFERHLAVCPECDAAVRQLAPLPGLLGRVEPAELEQSTPAAGPVPRLLAAIASARRRRRRWQVVAAAMVLAALVAAGALVVDPAPEGAGRPAPTVAPTVAMAEVDSGAPVAADLRLTREPAGTAVWMRCRYPGETGYGDQRRTFRLVAVNAEGDQEQLGSWRARPGDLVELTAMTHLSGADLRRVELRDADGATVLVHRP